MSKTEYSSLSTATLTSWIQTRLSLHIVSSNVIVWVWEILKRTAVGDKMFIRAQLTHNYVEITIRINHLLLCCITLLMNAERNWNSNFFYWMSLWLNKTNCMNFQSETSGRLWYNKFYCILVPNNNRNLKAPSHLQ